MERSGEAGKGTIVLATVKGDVHDIGKNLVDIILSNNGYDVVNIGIKQPISAILDAADRARADVIGMSGLLVKSTVVMRDNLAELNSRGLAGRWPVLLGGAALTRAYVEQDLASLFDGEVRYARDAFEGLRLMDAVMAVKRGEAGRAAARAARAAGAARRPRLRLDRARGHARPVRRGRRQPGARPRRSRRPGRQGHPARPTTRPSWTSGRRSWASGGSSRRAGAGGPVLRGAGGDRGRPRLRMWLDRIQTEGLLRPAVVYGYFPARQRGQRPGRARRRTGAGAGTVHVPAPAPRPPPVPGRLLPVPPESGETDVVGVPAGHRRDRGSAEATAELFAKNAYRDYLELHGLSVQLTEALAEYWHGRVRAGARHRRRRPGRPGRHPQGAATGAAGTRSATRPARTWRTGPRSCGCSTRSGSG